MDTNRTATLPSIREVFPGKYKSRQHREYLLNLLMITAEYFPHQPPDAIATSGADAHESDLPVSTEFSTTLV